MGFLNREEKLQRKNIQRSFLINILLVMLTIASLVLAVIFLIKVEKNEDVVAREKAEKERALSLELIEAQGEDDEDRVEELYLALKESDPVELDLRHLLFVTAAKRNETEFASELQKELAPENGNGGYPLSHYVIAVALSKKQGMDKNDFVTMNHHLMAAAGKEGVPEDAYRLLGDGNYAIGDFMSCIEAYRKIEKPSADTQYKIGLAFLQTKNKLQAIEELSKAGERYRESYEADNENTKALILWTKTMFLTGRINEAEKLLLDHLKKHDNVVVRNELIQSYLAQLMMTPNFIRRKEMLQRICDLDPSMRINPKTREAFFALGNYLVREQRYEEAKAYYHVCASRIEFPPSVKNNLAWVETRLPEGDLQSALTLSNEAISDSKQAAKPEYYGTRGQIKARLGQWESAKQDLEKALPDVAQKHEVQLALSVVYSRMGDNDKATKMFARAKIKNVANLDDLLTRYPN